MFKLCRESISNSLELIFRSCIENEKFLSDWKKASVVPVHKKVSKQVLKNYCPISLLPICCKIFEKVIFSKMSEF